MAKALGGALLYFRICARGPYCLSANLLNFYDRRYASYGPQAHKCGSKGVPLYLQKFLIILGIVFFSNVVFATADNNTKKLEFHAGEHFEILPNLVRSSPEVMQLIKKDNNPVKYKPQVVMFFNYGCYGCWRINKDFKLWAKNNSKKASVYVFPVVLGKMWENLAQLYYLNEELFSKDDGESIFVAIHQNHTPLWIESEVLKFYEQRNIRKEVTLEKYKSFNIDRKMKQAISIAKAYKVFVTPNIIINGKNNSYMINFAMVPDPETLFKVIDYLIKENPTK